MSAPTTWLDLAARAPVFGDCGILLLSGGMDSVACLHLIAAAYPSDCRRALLVDYGQPHRDRELGAAQRAAVDLGVAWDRIAVADALHVLRPVETMANAPHVDGGGGDHPATIPLRNLFLETLAAMHAVGRWPRARVDVWIGACLDDVAGFIDCHPDMPAQNTVALTVNAGQSVRVVAPLLGVSKETLVRCAPPVVLADLRRSWSCYRGGSSACGECTPCVLRTRAFAACELHDTPVGVPIVGGDTQREQGRR